MRKIHVIVRDKEDPSKQMQLIFDPADGTTGSVGVVMNKGLEMIVISAAVSDDTPLLFREENNGN